MQRSTSIVMAISALGALALAPAALAQDTRFAVVDITSGGRNETVTSAVERDVIRLRPGAKPLEDPAMRRLLATGEGPTAAATRLTREAEEFRAGGDCAGAVERATAAETLTLAAVSLDDERELLRTQYTVLVACEHERGRIAERDAAARRLRALVSLPPPNLPTELWQSVVANATAGTATTELHVDSDPPNAQIAINFHGQGVTPSTLKVAPGTVYVEVQKEGYLKAFRKLQVGSQPARTVFRLIDRTHDRLDQALATVNVLRRGDAAQKPAASTLSRLAQLARADMLVLLAVKGDRAKIYFFDAERGALSSDIIDSPVDPATGRVAALAARGTPTAPAPPAAAPSAPAKPSAAAPAIPPPAAHESDKPAGPSAPAAAVTGTTQDPQVTDTQAVLRRRRKPTAWWSWAIAGALAAGLLTYIYLDRPKEQSTLAARAFWNPPETQ
jgi:hypothetical protein